jgi:acetoin utilization deacetylase AcuC-like enzyme
METISTICVLHTPIPIEVGETTHQAPTNYPELRQQNILSTLSEKYPIIQNNSLLTLDDINMLDVHNPDMIRFLEGAFTSAPHTTDEGIIPYNFTKRPLLPYVDWRRLDLWRQAGLWCDDRFTPIFADTWTKALASASNSCAATNLIDRYRIIYCANLFPGHHATRSTYGGYCFLNNGALLAQMLRRSKKTEKMALLDTDYHAGNGAPDIFQNIPWPSLTISIHANPLLDYPFYTGYETENTSYKNRHAKNKPCVFQPFSNYNINIVFQPNTDLETYLGHLGKALDAICEFAPDVLIVPFGADTFRDDPDASSACRCQLEVDDYRVIGQVISSRFAGKIVVLQEGGYNMENVGLIVESFLDGLSSTPIM